ncbi:MAG TPA: transcriptional regulator [Acidimicrobiaceae bacterium]|nr:transcriptional regulator [Acidimicrobiaceae bacterium]HCB37511.1 transcriptional regulator [Acidimicrobiaceae bacterium]
MAQARPRPSGAAPGTASRPSSGPHTSDPLLLVWLALRLKGLGEIDGIAEVHGLALDETEDLLAQLTDAGRCQYRAVDGVEKFILTAAGRDDGEAALAAELDAAGVRTQVEAAYRQFRRLNPTMLRLCTDWQVVVVPASAARRLNDHDDPAYDDAVVARLADLDVQVDDVLGTLAAALARYAGYRPRFTAALARLVAGERDYFTKPVVSSYHTVWFELHEDLLATLNLNRADEATE